MRVVLRDELDALEALALVDGDDRDEARRALRASLKVRPEDRDAFERLFDVFWTGAEPPAPRPRPALEAPRASPRAVLRWDPDTRTLEGAPGAAAEGDLPGYSPEALRRRSALDGLAPSAADLTAMERLLARFARRLETRRSRRLVATRGRGRPDLRRSFRRALRTEGHLFTLARRTRALDDPRLVFLVDTSGSMDAHGRFLLAFVLALRRAVPGVEVFAFNTDLVRLTRSLAPGKVALALHRLAEAVPDWSGGTRIGECLAAFAARHGTALLDTKTVVVVLSDGLDRGDPAVLARAMADIRRRVRKVIWLNPLLGDPRYEPTARGMQAALPHVDHLAPAHDLASLERLLPHLAA